MRTMERVLAQGLVVLGLLLGAIAPGHATETVVYYHTDALGSPVAVTDASGTVIERSEYEPYGKLLNRPLEDGPRFTGHVSDAATGLSYMQQRYYDPAIGRFLSIDPIAASPGSNFNRYSYANNNPYRFKDPDGRYACSGDKCKTFEAALQKLRDQAKTLQGKQADVVNNILGLYGALDQNTGVTVSFASMKSYGGTVTYDRGSKTKITIDTDRIRSDADSRNISFTSALGAIALHEGQHGIDQRQKRGMPTTRFRELDDERNGARAEAFGFQMSGEAAWWSTWTPESGFNETNIEKEAQAATNMWCESRPGADGC